MRCPFEGGFVPMGARVQPNRQRFRKDPPTGLKSRVLTALPAHTSMHNSWAGCTRPSQLLPFPGCNNCQLDSPLIADPASLVLASGSNTSYFKPVL